MQNIDKKTTKNKKISLLLNILKNSNDELIKRTNQILPICPIFRKKLLGTKIMNQYKFKIHTESRKKLNNIAKNKVHLINETSKHNLDKKKIGILFSGGPSPGGHNVIAGLFDALKKTNPKSSLFGFIGGPDGIINENYIKIKKKIIDKYRNLGSFNMIKTGRTKINTNDKINNIIKTCKSMKLNGIVIIGGDDSNTNAAILAQKMFNNKINVIGVPKTIDGDICVSDMNNNILCETSFGFHTATNAFSKFINNLCIDASSDIKYWHFCKVMGRSTSNITLEVSFQTHPNLTLIGEELGNYINNKTKNNNKGSTNSISYNISLNKLISIICSAIVKRAKNGKNYGIIIMPEGILEFIYEIKTFITKLNKVIAKYNSIHKNSFHDTFKTLKDKIKYLTTLNNQNNNKHIKGIWNTANMKLFKKMPQLLQNGMLTERDNHGNFQFSQLRTEDIIINLVKKKLNSLKKKGQYKIGINKIYFNKIIQKENLECSIYGPILFKNWNKSNYLLLNNNISSKEEAIKILYKKGIINKKKKLPKSIEKIIEISNPNFKVQTHFYGYDGRGNNPTYFDSVYAYNLGKTAFHLLNNNLTGLMAGILNLDKNFNNWKPIGIPIAPLMHLEERKGKMSLVLKKSNVNLSSPSFKIFKILRKKWLLTKYNTDNYRSPENTYFTKKNKNKRPITLILNNSLKKTKIFNKFEKFIKEYLIK